MSLEKEKEPKNAENEREKKIKDYCDDDPSFRERLKNKDGLTQGKVNTEAVLILLNSFIEKERKGELLPGTGSDLIKIVRVQPEAKNIVISNIKKFLFEGNNKCKASTVLAAAIYSVVGTQRVPQTEFVKEMSKIGLKCSHGSVARNIRALGLGKKSVTPHNQEKISEYPISLVTSKKDSHCEEWMGVPSENETVEWKGLEDLDNQEDVVIHDEAISLLEISRHKKPNLSKNDFGRKAADKMIEKIYTFGANKPMGSVEFSFVWNSMGTEDKKKELNSILSKYYKYEENARTKTKTSAIVASALYIVSKKSMRQRPLCKFMAENGFKMLQSALSKRVKIMTKLLDS